MGAKLARAHKSAAKLQKKTDIHNSVCHFFAFFINFYPFCLNFPISIFNFQLKYVPLHRKIFNKLVLYTVYIIPSIWHAKNSA